MTEYLIIVEVIAMQEESDQTEGAARQESGIWEPWSPPCTGRKPGTTET